MKVILPPLITVGIIIAIILFVSFFPIGEEWIKSESSFDLLSPFFIIRNAVLIGLGALFTFIFSGGFSNQEGQYRENAVLLPITIGLAGGSILMLIVEPLWYPEGNIWTIIAYVLIWVVAEELFFRSFLTKSLMTNSNPNGTNIVALVISALLYAFWLTTYYPIVTVYSITQVFSIALLFFIVIALPVTASYYYTRSLISSGITNLVIKGLYIGYCYYLIVT